MIIPLCRHQGRWQRWALRLERTGPCPQSVRYKSESPAHEERQNEWICKKGKQVFAGATDNNLGEERSRAATQPSGLPAATQPANRSQRNVVVFLPGVLHGLVAQHVERAADPAPG